MAEPKLFASLSSTLLARKGAAKPAMRPQGFGQGVSLEDLGWNDMGTPPQPAAVPYEHVPTPLTGLTPAPRAEAIAAMEPPPVLEQQRAIEATFAAEPKKARPARPAAQDAVVSLPRERSVSGGKKAAFTLRLDTDRHLRLRLACAVTNRSAQQIVTEALDEFLASLPALDTIARQAAAGSRN